MMRYCRYTVVGALALLLASTTAWAQYPSPVADFDGPTIGDRLEDQEMFQIPQYSGTTRPWMVENVDETLQENAAWRDSGLVSPTGGGTAALSLRWIWIDPTDPNSWLRLTTFQGPVSPNPALDTRGKVRFILTSQPVFNAPLGVCLGIRETGVEVAQLANGGTSGPIEWFGVTTDLTVINAGSNGIIDSVVAGDDLIYTNGLEAISWGPNRVLDSVASGDDLAEAGYFIGTNGQRIPVPAIELDPPSANGQLVEWDFTANTVRVSTNASPGSFGPPIAVGTAAFTGNGDLSDAPNDRGVLEHIAFTTVVDNTWDGGDVIVAIDELQFEATVPDPVDPPSVIGPVNEGATSVQVQATPGASQTELFVNNISVGTATPNATTGVSTHSGLAALQAGDELTAKQTKDGITSDFSNIVLVFAQGVLLADNFDNYSSNEELLMFWNQSIANPTPPDARVRLQAGGAASCPNYLREDSPAGTPDGARLYYNLGSVNGTNEEPLWITWNFLRKGADGPAGARTRFELARFDEGTFNVGGRDEGSIGITIFNQAVGSPNILAFQQQFNLTYVGTPGFADGDTNGFYEVVGWDRALSGVEDEAGRWYKMQMEITGDYVNWYIDGVLVTPEAYTIAGGASTNGVPRANNLPFDSLIIGEGFSNNGPLFKYDNISVTQGAGGTLHPFGDPAPDVPFIVEPLTPGQTTVSLTDVNTNASMIEVFADGGSIASTMDVGTSGTLDIAVPALQYNEVITVVQTVDGEMSCDSIPATVTVPPPAIADAELVPGQTEVTVSGVLVGSATTVTVFANEINEIGSVTTSGFASSTVVVPVSALVDGNDITATQSVGVFESLASDPVTVAVPAPTIPSELFEGDSTVLVSSVHPLATLVAVTHNGNTSTAVPGGASAVEVTLTANLVAGTTVSATQTIGGVVGPASNVVTVTSESCGFLFEDDMDSETGWTVNFTADTAYQFGYDYSAMGIPPSPNGGGTTTGLLMKANLVEPGGAEYVVATPMGLSLSGQFRVVFDIWLNANGPFPGGGTGSTEYIGGGVGYDGTTAGLVGGIFLVDGEGGSSRDYRMYKNAGEQFVASGQYDVDTNNNSGVDLSAYFPSQSPPAFQQANYPQQTGSTAAGAGGFAWHQVVLTVDSDAGTVNCAVDGLSIGTLSTSIGSDFPIAGNVQVMYADVFSSVSDNADLSFGIVDNFAVLEALGTPGTAGDWDNDGNVDGDDLARFVDCLAGPSVVPSPISGVGCASVCRTVFDFDVDDDIDLVDFAEFMRVYNP